MLLSLPPSLLSLLLCLLDARVLADSAPSPTPTAHNIADYVASGFGINNTSSDSKNAPSLVSSGSGLEYASKCDAALKTWSSSSFSYGWNNAIVTTETFSSAITDTHRLQGTTKVTSKITLCDGYPRIVGRTSISNGQDTTSTASWINTYTESKFNSAYPTPVPCSIQPSDCENLSSRYESNLSGLLSKYGQATIAAPLCTVTPSSSYSFSTDQSNGATCDNCQIHASTARVMFWPITTAAGGNLCNKTGSTITASPTGPPNSFVTKGVTITSPSVAISLAYMSRVDGCGTTINHTIIPVHPDQVTSVRGFRALFEHRRFNFADLNYFCMDSNKTMATIPEGEGDSCYQQVPAEAYFGGLNNAVVYDQAPFRNLTKDKMTIWDDYQPQLLPPATMSDAISSIWGDNCIIHPDGVWDPPIALTPEAALVVPTAPGGGSDATTTPATPINSYAAEPPRQTGIAVPTQPSEGDGDGASPGKEHFTALPETGGYGGDGSAGGQSVGEGSGQQGSDGGSGSGQQGGGAGPGNNGGSNGGSSSGEQGSTGGAGSGNNGGSSGGSGSGQQGLDGDSGTGNNGGSSGGSGTGNNGGSGSGSNGGSNTGTNGDSQNGNSGTGSGSSNQGQSVAVKVHTTIITIGSKTLQATQNSQGAWVIPDASTTHIASPGGSAVEVGAATLTAGNHGLVNMHTSVMTIGSKTLTCTQDDNGAWVVPDSSTTYTVSQGGSAVTVDAATLTAASDGLVDMHATTMTVGDKVVTYSQDSNGAWVIADGTTTHTASRGGSAIEVDGITLTAASGGLSNVHASKTGANSQSSGATSTGREQFTSTTASGNESSATDTSGAGHATPRLTVVALALVALFFCAI